MHMLGGIDAHHRLGIACLLAVLAFWLLHGRATMATQLVASWDVFAFVTIVLAFTAMISKDPYEVRRNAGQQDSNRTFLFVLVITAATASLFAVFICWAR